MPLLRAVLLIMTITTSSFLFAPSARPNSAVPTRLAIYYGYPSLVNGSLGDVEKAAGVFADYGVVVLGDGLEFTDKQPGRYPEGDPAEHRKTLQIVAAVRKRSPGTRFYGYVCLGEIPWPKGQQTALSTKQLEERIQLWKQMGVSGIFLDEAGYDFPVVTRERQNLAVRMIHDLGLSAFMNAYFIEHLFSLENQPLYANGSEKNPGRLAPLLDQRDLFLLESFEVKNGVYESTAAAQKRLNQALAYRRRYGTHIFVTTTTTEQQPFSAEKFNYAWWTARVYGLDGFSWGEPDFAAVNNSLPVRRCGGESTTLPAFEPSSAVASDSIYFWRKAGPYLVVVDTGAHSVRRIPSVASAESKSVRALLSSSPSQSPLTCDGATP
ncbi:MAG: hypothetical protein WBQ89_12660 [Candidatus Acidiferrum sp.]